MINVPSKEKSKETTFAPPLGKEQIVLLSLWQTNKQSPRLLPNSRVVYLFSFLAVGSSQNTAIGRMLSTVRIPAAMILRTLVLRVQSSRRCKIVPHLLNIPLQLCTSILEPCYNLRVREVQQFGEFVSVLRREVFLVQESSFQLVNLLVREAGAGLSTCFFRRWFAR